jgi:hypothetical protein
MDEAQTESLVEATETMAEVPGYRPLSLMALFGLVLGIVSLLALVHPVFWLVPAVAVGVNAVALWRIAQAAPPMIGRRLGQMGLALSLILLVAAPAHVFLDMWIMRVRALRLADQWFGYLANNKPHLAHRLTMDAPGAIPKDEEEVWGFYRAAFSAEQSLREWLYKPEVRALLRLGRRARVRLYRVLRQTPLSRGQLVEARYAVTFEEGGKPKSFLVDVAIKRAKFYESGVVVWNISSSDLVTELPPELKAYAKRQQPAK